MATNPDDEERARSIRHVNGYRHKPFTGEMLNGTAHIFGSFSPVPG